MTDTTLRNLVRGAYDIQKLRIQTGNRIVANYKAKLGQAPGSRESDIDEEGQDLLRVLRQSYRTLTEGVVAFPRLSSFKGDEVISSYTELALVGQYVGLEKSEDEHFGRLANALKGVPIYDHFLSGVKGIGPAMAGVIVSEIDIHKAKYPSSLWSYAGLDVAGDGRGRSRRQEHLIEREYTTRDGEAKVRKGITFNPFLKTKLTGVLGPSFLRAANPKYAPIYRDYKHRLESHAVHAEKTKAHRHNMAIRYMVKIFLLDLYVEWRTLEGLEVSKPYHEAKLGHVHAA